MSNFLKAAFLFIFGQFIRRDKITTNSFDLYVSLGKKCLVKLVKENHSKFFQLKLF